VRENSSASVKLLAFTKAALAHAHAAWPHRRAAEEKLSDSLARWSDYAPQFANLGGETGAVASRQPHFAR
jgi:hypothetical protein